ncbi:MAG TPA: endo alpha-1,4 polygalactosaminidase [Polyangiaceae bacterium]
MTPVSSGGSAAQLAGAGNAASAGTSASFGGSSGGQNSDAGAASAGRAGAEQGGSDGVGGSSAGGGHAGTTGSTAGSDAGGASAGAAGGSGAHWQPAPGTTFYWDLQNAPPDNTKNVGAYDIDGWGNTAKEVTQLHALGIKVVCYMDAGTYEPGRPDSSMFPADLEGNAVEGWPGEVWLDVRAAGSEYATLQAIMLARFKVCQSKGFDAVEPDNIDSYQNKPGFNTSAADQLAYNQWIATTVHSLGMAVFQKNDLDQVEALEPSFDGILDEECNKYSECDTLAPYTAAGKPVWDAEYKDDGETTAKFCAADVNANIAGALFSLDLDGSLFEPCTNDVGKLN